ncbi:hypothetical protein BGZ92_004933, partial [Podila epicladia]
MRFKLTLCAALSICTSLVLAQVDVDTVATESFSAEPIGFLKIGRDRYLPITSSEYESYRRDGENTRLVNEYATPAPDQVTATSVSDDVQAAILKTHNDLRALHNSPALTWDDRLASFGEDWVQACKFKHSHGPYGENLAAGHHDFHSAIIDWYNEAKDYDFNNPGFSGKTGHFTQVVWKATTSIGCAMKLCPTWPIYICNYSPP